MDDPMTPTLKTGCDAIDAQLVAFHFSVLDEPARAEVERHLFACSACVRSFFAVKREIDSDAGLARPSEASRIRLRAAVAQKVRGGRTRRRVVYSAMAAAMVLVALGVGLRVRLAPAVGGTGAPAVETRRAGGTVDSARVIPENLDYL